MSDKTKRYTDTMVDHFQITQHPGRRWMATANRDLSFRKVNRLLRDEPPSVVLRTGYRVFLFRTGSDRDLFVEHFHRGFEARVYAPS